MIDPLVKDIIRHLNINQFIETGTDKGETVAEVSRWFSEIYPRFGTIKETFENGSRSYNLWNTPIAYPVFTGIESDRYQIHSVDNDEYSYSKAKENFKSNKNIFFYLDTSHEFLRKHLSGEKGGGSEEENYLFFLDAHWGEDWPLREEIALITKLKRFLIVIDDFFVPGKSDPSHPHGLFGYDIYGGQILSWAYIVDLFKGLGVRVFYPTRPNRDRRGLAMIFNGYSKEQLKCVDNLELTEIEPFKPQHTAAIKAQWLAYLDIRNIVKRVLPLNILRSVQRIYEKCLER